MNLHRRIPAGAAALIFFAMFFALPLYAAATICTMPCCHHASPGAKLKGDLQGCPIRECSITTDETTVKAVSRYVAPVVVAVVQVATTATMTAGERVETAYAPQGGRGRPPLHVLNSTFRI